MVQAVVVQDLGFGDSGKGATTDYLVRQLGADLVVRFCGGHQAAHHVQLPSGKRHCFAQFGAGTLAGANTYLGPQMMIEPLAMAREAEHLGELGIGNVWKRLVVHPNCLVTTYYHQLKNLIVEQSRGNKAHGSCYAGIGATREYHLRYGNEAIKADDLYNKDDLHDKLKLLKQRTIAELEFVLPPGHLEHIDRVKEQQSGWLSNTLCAASSQLILCDHLLDWGEKAIVFEGSQGVLLDETYGFNPHTTWGTVTPKYALDMIDDWGIDEWCVLGVTRAYLTRHGYGPFPTCDIRIPGADYGNEETAGRGEFRSGSLNFDLLRYGIECCEGIDGLVVTCLDHVDEETKTNIERVENLPPIWLRSYGPTHEDRRPAGFALSLLFRSRAENV